MADLTRRRILQLTGAGLGVLALGACTGGGSGGGGVLPPRDLPTLPWAGAPVMVDGARVGWNIYSSGAATTEHIEKMAEHRPSVIRWMVEWDRYEEAQGAPTSRYDWSSKTNYNEFFDACAANDVMLVVQLWVKELGWWGEKEFDGKNMDWARATTSRNYPGNVDSSYGTFVRSLYGAIRDRYQHFGADTDLISVGAFNEADLRWQAALLKAWRGDTEINLGSRWSSGAGFWGAKWTGGYGEKWAELHQVLDGFPGVVWNNSAVGSVSDESGRVEEWIQATDDIGRVSQLDIHKYLLQGGNTLSGMIDAIDTAIDRWDAIRPSGLDFYIGESGPSAKDSSLPFTAADRTLVQNVHAELASNYSSRFIGFIPHGSDAWTGADPWWV